MRPLHLVVLATAALACTPEDVTETPNTPPILVGPGTDPVPDPEAEEVLLWDFDVDARVQDYIADPDPDAGGIAVSGTPTSGDELIADPDEVWIADTTEGALLRFDRASSTWTSFELWGEPTRLLRIGDALFVTLRLTGELVRLDLSSGEPVEVMRVYVGAEPFDLVASKDAQRLYVSLSQEDAVVALHTPSLTLLGRWTMSGEPRGLALVGDGVRFESVFVGTARWSSVKQIRVNSGEVRTIGLPSVFAAGSSCDPAGPRELVARITGDLAVTDDASVLVPTLYVDPKITDPVHGGEVGAPPEPSSCASGGGGYGVPVTPEASGEPGRFTPTVTTIPEGGDGQPFVTTVGTASGPDVVRSYPGQAVPKGDQIVVSAPGDSAIVTFDPGSSDGKDSAALRSPVREATRAPSGARSLAVSADGALFTWSFLERTLGEWSSDLTEVTEHTAPASSLAPNVQAGLALFYDASNPDVSAPSSGVSCETCHLDGRNDATVWEFPDMHRQTPSLAADPELTAPFTWLGNVASVQDEVVATTTLRMLGKGLTEGQVDDLASAVLAIRPPSRPRLPQAAVQRGERVFYRPDVGCAGCHSGPGFSDGRMWQVVGFPLATNTPSLRGIGGSAPYLHDGSARTLSDLVWRMRDRSMGDTSMLTAQEADDLVTFLMTL